MIADSLPDVFAASPAADRGKPFRAWTGQVDRAERGESTSDPRCLPEDDDRGPRHDAGIGPATQATRD